MNPVVWALDAFSSKKDWPIHFKTARAIHAYAPEAQIHPVYILSEQVFSDRGYSSFLRPGLKPMALRNLNALLSHDALFDLMKSGQLLSPKVVVEISSDAEVCVEQFLRYALNVNAAGIAIGTHARSPIARLFSGSFSQTLIHKSRIPVLITGAYQQEDPQPIKTVIVPTDFKPEGREDFEAFLEFALQRNLDVELFYKQIETFENWMQSDAYLLGGGWSPIVESHTEEEDRYAEAEIWLRRAREAGVRVHVTTEIFRESSADCIIQYANRLADRSPMIAILRPIDWLDGSVLRDLIQTSPYPLYVKDFGEPRQQQRDELADRETALRW